MIFLLLACSSPKEADPQGAASVQLTPSSGGQGTRLTLRLEADAPAFSDPGLALDPGEGIAVEAVEVADAWSARVQIWIDEQAELGTRELSLQSGAERWGLPFEVRAESFLVQPDRAYLGEAVALSFVGTGTAWEAGQSWPGFGEGVEVVDFTVLDAESAVGTVVISPSASVGWRDVEIQSGAEQRLVQAEGFLVDRAALVGSFSPESAMQGETVTWRVEARGTSFVQGEAEVELLDASGAGRDIEVFDSTVVTTSAIVGQLTVSNGALPGLRDVRVRTADGGGLLLPDAFTVLAAPFRLEDVAVDLRFTIERTIDAGTGELSESVSASCTFFTPLDPPCTGSSDAGSLGSPSRYDLSEAFGMEAPGDSGADCPLDPSYDAGEQVWLEGPENIITLHRVEDVFSGLITYRASDLPLADYVLDSLYDLRIEGSEDQVGPALIEGVQPTLAADWALLSPSLWGNEAFSRARELCIAWTPAQTYPDALFLATLWARSSPGPLSTEGWLGYVGALPWDDGDFCFQPDDLAVLAPGIVPVYLYSYLEGPAFGLPGSSYQDNRARSWIRVRGSLVLD